MTQNIIPVSVDSRYVAVDDHVPITAGNVGVDFIQITLDEEWDEFPRKYVTFSGSSDIPTTVDWDDIIPVPWEQVTAECELHVGVQGLSTSGEVVINEDGTVTYPADAKVINTRSMREAIMVRESGTSSGTEPSQPTHSTLQRVEEDIVRLEAGVEFTKDVPEYMEQISTAISNSEAATANAEEAGTYAYGAGDAATAAKSAAIEATRSAIEATSAAEQAKNDANAAALRANTAANSADRAAQSASYYGDYAKEKGDAAATASIGANASAANADSATDRANTAADNAITATNSANTAKDDANTAAADALRAAENANSTAAAVVNPTHSWSGSILTVTTSSGTSSANLKGEKGDPGKDGDTPVKGVDYFDGKDGRTPVKGVDYFDGKDGEDGEPFTYDMLTQEQKDEMTPKKGIDYFTAAEKAELINEVSSAVGGLEYMFLASDQYDHATGIPNFTGKSNVFYFVPDLGGVSPNMFIEFLYTTQGWEQVGASTIDLDGYATEEWVEGKGYLTSFTETDPTVPSWAKQPSKPSYTAQEVGALPSDTRIPSKVSDLTNDSGFLTSFTETDPTVPAWAKADTKPSYTYAEVGAAAENHEHSQYAVASTLKKVATSGSYDDLSGKPSIPTVYDWARQESKPSYTASEVGAAEAAHTHSQYLTEHQSLAEYATKSYVDDAVASSAGGGVVVLDASQVDADGKPTVVDAAEGVIYLAPSGDTFTQWIYTSESQPAELYPYDIFSIDTYQNVVVDDTIYTSRMRSNPNSDMSVYCWSTDNPSSYPVGEAIATPYNKVSALQSSNTLMYMTGDYLTAAELTAAGVTIGSTWAIYKLVHRRGDVMTPAVGGWVQIGGGASGGVRLYTGSGVPDSSIGSDGDVFLAV